MSSEHSTPDSTEYAIEVTGLSKCYQIYDKPSDRLKQMLMRGRKQYYKEFWALKDVSFKIKKGETVGIIGRNGSGKSTLLQMICGTLNPTGGEIKVNGRVAALLELGAGFNPEFSGVENVYMAASLYGLSKEEVDQRFDDIATFADIGDHIHQSVKTYSSGMYVRLAFAVIAHVDADILVVDEALAVGDAYFTQKCLRFINIFKENGGTLLFVSHDTAAMLSLCGKCMLLNKGYLALIDSPKSVLEVYLTELYGLTQETNGVNSNINGLVKEIEIEKDGDFKVIKEIIPGEKKNGEIKISKFDVNASGFGDGGALIANIKITDERGRSLNWASGGDLVILQIAVSALRDISNPIIGFVFADRLGQALFVNNTYFKYLNEPPFIAKGDNFKANFVFKLPLLPVGDYMISPAVADGGQYNHIQLHWLHDALHLKVHSSAVAMGLFGVLMDEVYIEIVK